jgi:hypothetical protein
MSTQQARLHLIALTILGAETNYEVVFLLFQCPLIRAFVQSTAVFIDCFELISIFNVSLLSFIHSLSSSIYNQISDALCRFRISRQP